TSDAAGLRIYTSSDTNAFTPASTYLGTSQPNILQQLGQSTSSAATTSNVFAGSTLDMYSSTTVNSLRLDSGGGVNSLSGGLSNPLFNASGAVNTLTVSSGGVLAYTGNTGISKGAITAGGALLILHTLGNLEISSYVLGSGGIVKADSGTLTL